MNVSELIATTLRAAGIETIYGYPGDPSVEFLEGCRKEGVEFVLARREGTAGLMAEAYGMLTGKPGVTLSTLGPGSTNLVNAVANAHLDRVPMIALSGQIDTQRRPTFTHQVVDQHAIFAPVAKWVADVAPHNTGEVMRKALRMAVAPRPGPVHLSTPADVVGADVVGAAATDAAADLPPTGPEDVEALTLGGGAAAMFEGARRPIVLYGISAMQAGAGPELVALAERTGAALVSSPMAKGTVDETHPLFAGTLDMACNAVMWSFMDEADLIVAAGFDAVELIKPWKVSADVLHVDVVPNTDQIYAAVREVVAPLRASLRALTGAVAESEGWGEAAIRRHREGLRDAYLSGRVGHAVNPSEVVDAVLDAAPGAVVSTDVGSHKLLVGQGWRATRERSFLMTNGLSSMGFSLPAAIAAAKLHPDREVVCFTGDGGLAMVQSELQLAASLGLSLRVVVFLDRSLNRIELKQMAKGYPSTGTVIEDTDIEKLASAMGCDGIVCETEAAMADALSRAPQGRPLVVGVRVDPAQYEAQF